MNFVTVVKRQARFNRFFANIQGGPKKKYMILSRGKEKEQKNMTLF